MLLRNLLLHYVFSKLTITCEQCQLVPTHNLEQFRGLFSYLDWELMFGSAVNIVPGYGEVVLGVRSSSGTKFIGFIRILFAEENTDDAEFHCGFHFESFADKRAAAVGSLLILKLYLSMLGGCPLTKVRRSNNAAMSWSKKLGFTSNCEVGDYIHLHNHCKSDAIDEFLERYHISNVAYTSKNLAERFLRTLLQVVFYMTKR